MKEQITEMKKIYFGGKNAQVSVVTLHRYIVPNSLCVAISQLGAIFLTQWNICSQYHLSENHAYF